MKIKLTIFLALFLCMGSVGCEDKEDNKNDNQSIIGTWKCIGFGNAEKREVKPLEPKDCEECYVIKFKENQTFEGRSNLLVLSGNYKIDNNTIKLSNLNKSFGTYISEMGSGDNFRTNFSLIKSWNIKDRKLKLFYSETEYLLFNSKNN